jgi:hypothetical protein
MKRTEIISPFNSYLLSSGTAVRVHRGSYSESSADIYAVSISYSSDGTEVSVQDVTSTLSSCDTDLLQFIALTYVICHSILSPVLNPLTPNDIYVCVYIYIYIYMSYLTTNLQTLHFIYLVNKYTY